MSRDRRPARPEVPQRTPDQLVDALRDLAAESEEPVLGRRRRFVAPPDPDFDDGAERDAAEPDLLWRRPEPSRAQRPPGQARRDRASLGRTPSARAERTPAGLSPLRLGA